LAPLGFYFLVYYLWHHDCDGRAFLYDTQFLNFPLNGMFALHWLEAGLNFTVTFFNYEHFSTYIAKSIISGFVSSPFWFVLDGIVWGLLIGWIVTKMAGDGTDAVHGSEDVMKP
jgi:hypothetical protein